MYYPYFRGKQFELLGIREFIANDEAAARIHPVIEPVRDPALNAGLRRAITALHESKFGFTLIVNPTVGKIAKLEEKTELILNEIKNYGCTPSNTRLGLIVSPTFAAEDVAETIKKCGFEDARFDLIYPGSTPPAPTLAPLSELHEGIHIAPNKNVVRQLRDLFPKPEVVRLSDNFPTRERNTDYEGEEPSVLCDDLLYFEEDGFIGFSDYLTIGQKFNDGGSTPRAVVIHLSYQTEPNGPIYIRHFLSETNFDTSDVAGKFLEALAKLIAFVDLQRLENPAIDAFRDYHDREQFPGLGMIKKLSMLNHLYVVDSALTD